MEFLINKNVQRLKTDLIVFRILQIIQIQGRPEEMFY